MIPSEYPIRRDPAYQSGRNWRDQIVRRVAVLLVSHSNSCHRVYNLQYPCKVLYIVYVMKFSNRLSHFCNYCWENKRLREMTLPTQTNKIPYRQIRASYDEDTITVYQAYSAEIAIAAVQEQRLSASPKFSGTRMTWIKPSWCWMM